MNTRKKIGVITTDILNVYQRELMRGLQEEAFAFDCDVLVYAAFNSFLKGELNIFSAIHYDRLDGMIVMPDKLVASRESEDVLDNLKQKYHGPVIFVDYDTEEYPSVKEETEAELRPLLAHLYDVHGVRDIACLTGKKGHPHAENRLQSYLNFMKEKGLPIRENRVFYGDFWYDRGEQVLETMLNSPEGLPEAVVCGSDAMALSIFEACRKRKIRIPEEILITGFDADNDGIVKKYFVTSIRRDGYTTGVNAIRRIMGMIEHTEIPMKPWNSTILIGETCGCVLHRRSLFKVDISRLRQQQDEDFFSDYNAMLEDCIGAENLAECFNEIDRYTWYLKEISGFSLCLCEDWLGNIRDDRKFRRKGYSDRLYLMFERRGTHTELGERLFPGEDMLPMLWEERPEPGCFLFAPLHLQERCFGYIVLHYIGHAGGCPDYTGHWVRNCCNALEAMRRLINEERINAQLTETYRQMEKNAVTDALTGLYNRNGFNDYAKEQIHLGEREGKQLVVLMGDLNCLKTINDTYGHTEGDFAIKEAARAVEQFLQQRDSAYERCYRIGGDEYTAIIVGNLTEEEIGQREKAVHDYLRKLNADAGKPYQVSVSLGISVEDPRGKNLEQVIQNADERMYREKQRFKRQSV